VRSQTEENGLLTLESFRVLSFIARGCEVDAPPMQRGCRRLFNGWMSVSLRDSSRVPRGRNLRIDRLARRVDARLHPVLLHRIAGFVWRRFKAKARKFSSV